MIKIGLTGGIGAGKSTVSKYLIKKGYVVLDADLIAKDLIKEDGESVSDIVSLLGEEVLNNDGSLNRKSIAKIVYNDEYLLHEYEKLTTYKVIDYMLTLMDLLEDEKIVFADVPLLFEKGMYLEMDYNWVVITDDKLRINRILERDKIPEEMIRDIIKNQMPQNEKIKLSDEVLDNSESVENLYKQIDDLLSKYV